MAIDPVTSKNGLSGSNPELSSKGGSLLQVIFPSKSFTGYEMNCLICKRIIRVTS